MSLSNTGDSNTTSKYWSQTVDRFSVVSQMKNKCTAREGLETSTSVLQVTSLDPWLVGYLDWYEPPRFPMEKLSWDEISSNF